MPTTEQDQEAKDRAIRLFDEWQQHRSGFAIEELSAFLAGVVAAEKWMDRYTLPCDVKLLPATIIRKGCTMRTLLSGLIRREKITG